MENDDLYCIGCGSKIQTEVVSAVGYVPPALLDKYQEGDLLYCQRCFRLRHYSEILPTNLTNQDFLKILQKIGRKDALMVYLIDLFDFNGALLTTLHQIMGAKDFLIVANKRDLLPHSLKVGKLTSWLKDRVREEALNPVGARVISALTESDVSDLMQEIELQRKGRDVYVVGATNVGKSTLVNAMIRIASDHLSGGQVITTSRFPGTTLNRIAIPLDKHSRLVDTPGIIQYGQMTHYLKKEDLKYVSPSKEIKPKTYQLNPGQTVFYGGVVRFDFVEGERQGITSYLNNGLSPHRTKLTNADQFYGKHAGDLLRPDILQPLVSREFSIHRDSDLVIAGLGWIHVAKSALVKLWVPQGVDVSVRRALV